MSAGGRWLYISLAGLCFLQPNLAEASFWTKVRDAATAPIRVPAKAVITVIKEPTLKNALTAGVSQLAGYKEAVEGGMEAVNHLVEQNPKLKAVVVDKQIAIAIPIEGGAPSTSSAQGGVLSFQTASQSTNAVGPGTSSFAVSTTVQPDLPRAVITIGQAVASTPPPSNDTTAPPSDTDALASQNEPVTTAPAQDEADRSPAMACAGPAAEFGLKRMVKKYVENKIMPPGEIATDKEEEEHRQEAIRLQKAQETCEQILVNSGTTAENPGDASGVRPPQPSVGP